MIIETLELRCEVPQSDLAVLYFNSLTIPRRPHSCRAARVLVLQCRQCRAYFNPLPAAPCLGICRVCDAANLAKTMNQTKPLEWKETEKFGRVPIGCLRARWRRYREHLSAAQIELYRMDERVYKRQRDHARGVVPGGTQDYSKRSKSKLSDCLPADAPPPRVAAPISLSPESAKIASGLQSVSKPNRLLQTRKTLAAKAPKPAPRIEPGDTLSKSRVAPLRVEAPRPSPFMSIPYARDGRKASVSGGGLIISFVPRNEF